MFYCRRDCPYISKLTSPLPEAFCRFLLLTPGNSEKTKIFVTISSNIVNVRQGAPTVLALNRTQVLYLFGQLVGSALCAQRALSNTSPSKNTVVTKVLSLPNDRVRPSCRGVAVVLFKVAMHGPVVALKKYTLAVTIKKTYRQV